MVEIPRPHPPRFADEDRYRLVYSKSKVYVNPTAYARDNIPGFVALVRRVCDARTSPSLLSSNRRKHKIHPICLHGFQSPC